MSESLTQSDGFDLAEGLSATWGGIILAEGLHDWGRRVLPLF
jgi:hypothetical protein